MSTIVKKTEVKFGAIKGNYAAKLALEMNVILPALNPALFEGLRKPAKGILLFGPPGNGKTMLAQAVANESGVKTFFNISASAIQSRWLGEGERMVKALFQVAHEQQPSIIFIDELDSLLKERSAGESSGTRNVKTELLVQMDGVSGKASDRILVLGATNRPDELDEAALRRFPRRIFIDMPDEAARAEMIKKTFFDGKTEISLTDDQIATLAERTQFFSYSDLHALCSAAALMPLKHISREQLRQMSANKVPPVDMACIEEALLEIRPSSSATNRERLIKWAKEHAASY